MEEVNQPRRALWPGLSNKYIDEYWKNQEKPLGFLRIFPTHDQGAFSRCQEVGGAARVPKLPRALDQLMLVAALPN